MQPSSLAESGGYITRMYVAIHELAFAAFSRHAMVPGTQYKPKASFRCQ